MANERSEPQRGDRWMRHDLGRSFRGFVHEGTPKPGTSFPG
jgi:hypothetical protein